jgi:hypothetical protein
LSVPIAGPGRVISHLDFTPVFHCQRKGHWTRHPLLRLFHLSSAAVAFWGDKALINLNWRHELLAVLLSFLFASPAFAQNTGEFSVRKENVSSLSQQVEDLKQAALELNRDLLILEEDLLFPANTQIAVYVSSDVGHYFQLDAIKLHVDNQLVASHLYTEKQNSALNRGGIQRLYLGNLKTGKHEITAFVHGYGPQRREYKRAATYTLKKDQKPTMLEMRIKDSTASMEPEFEFKEWQVQ